MTYDQARAILILFCGIDEPTDEQIELCNKFYEVAKLVRWKK